jgi:hypothetical protein
MLICRYVQDILAETESSRGTTQVSIEPDGSWKMEAPKTNGKRKRSDDSGETDSDGDLFIVPPRSVVKTELAASPFSPAPGLSASASSTGRSYSTSAATPKSKKRPSLVIDLTLSDDDEPLKQRTSSSQHVSSKPRSQWPRVSPVSFPVPAQSQNNSPPSNSIFMSQSFQLPNMFQPQGTSRSSMENDVWGLLDQRSPVWQGFTPPESHRNGS